MTKTQITAGDRDAQIVNGVSTGFTTSVSTSFRQNTGIFQATAADLDQWKYERYFPKSGTYKIKYVYTKDSDKGKVDIGINRIGANRNTTNITNQLDTYASSTTYNQEYTSTVQISRGLNEINFKVNGKNASSSSYRILTQFLLFELIAEHSVAGEEGIAQINQGSMVLLARHKAEIAESTKTFNLADIDLKNKYAYLLIKVRGQTTAALSLQMKVNNLAGSFYHSDGERNAGGTATQIDTNTATIHTILSAAILTGASSVFTTETIIEIDPVGNYLQGKSQGGQVTVGREIVDWGYNIAGAITNSKITSVEILTSTSTWKAGTIIEIYGVRRN